MKQIVATEEIMTAQAAPSIGKMSKRDLVKLYTLLGAFERHDKSRPLCYTATRLDVERAIKEREK
jgi:hypothetical protein